MQQLIRLSPDDNVAVATVNIRAGADLQADDVAIRALEPIPFAHKIALRAIEEGERVIKYGVPIGRAKAPIPAGSHVHVHNIRSDYVNNEVDFYEATTIGDEAGGPTR